MRGLFGIRPWAEYSTSAQKAVVVAVVLLAVCLIVQVVNSADHYRLVDEFGLRPRRLESLPTMASSCFVHLSWEHFEGNSVFILFFGYFAAYQGLGKFAIVTLVVMVTSNLYWWVLGPAGLPSAGASGMIWGWFGYSLARGVFHYKELPFDVRLLLVVPYAVTCLDLIFPGNAEWQAHVGGLVGGLLCGVALRNHPANLAVCSRSGGAEPTGQAEPPGETALAGGATIGLSRM